MKPIQQAAEGAEFLSETGHSSPDKSFFRWEHWSMSKGFCVQMWDMASSMINVWYLGSWSKYKNGLKFTFHLVHCNQWVYLRWLLGIWLQLSGVLHINNSVTFKNSRRCQILLPILFVHIFVLKFEKCCPNSHWGLCDLFINLAIKW